jgi:dephospho-CoA kinase
MIRVGVTGGIGSGKSTVCGLFAGLGAPVYDSDSRARELMNGNRIRDAVTALLGPESYRDGALDNTYVAGKVFADRTLLASLNAIVHPAVASDFEAWALSLTDRPYVVLESAILFESGFDGLVDRIVAVSAPVQVRLERVLQRARGNDGTGGRGDNRAETRDNNGAGARGDSPLSREQVMRRMANQMSDAERESRSDWTIDNSGGLRELAARVKEIDNLLKQ